jgi:multidrug resistance efflux pump
MAEQTQTESMGATVAPSANGTAAAAATAAATNAPIADAGPATDATQPAAAGQTRRRLRPLLIPFIAVVLIISGAVGINTYLNNLWYVSTDNAEIVGTPVPVGALNPGRVEAIDVDIGSQVHKGDVMARVELASSVASAVVRDSVRAPFDGTVIAIPVGVGATVQPGQGIVTIVDPSGLYVNANIEETKIGRVQVGQHVDVHVDALNADLPGQVQSITPASAASFSLIPSQNGSSGSFTKVTQLVPVHIAVDVSNQPLLVGSSVEVKIHVAGH